MKSDFLGYIWVVVPAFLVAIFGVLQRFIKANARKHAFLIQAFWSDQISNVHSNPGAWRHVFRDRLEKVPMHMTICCRILIQIQIVLIFYRKLPGLYYSWKWEIRLHWHLDDLEQISTFEPRIELEGALALFIPGNYQGGHVVLHVLELLVDELDLP